MAIKKYSSKRNNELNYEVKEVFGVLDSDSVNTKELRLVKWGDGDYKYDLRNWKHNEDGTETPLRGLTMDAEELQSLLEILKKLDEEEDNNEE